MTTIPFGVAPRPVEEHDYGLMSVENQCLRLGNISPNTLRD